MENYQPNLLEHDRTPYSSPLLSEHSNPEIEYMTQKYPKPQQNVREEKIHKGTKRILKNVRMRSDGSKLAQKTEKSKSLKGVNKENSMKSLPKPKATLKTKETKRDPNNKNEKKSELKDYLLDLEDKIEKQHKKIKNIKTNLEERKNNFQEYSKNLKDSKKLEKLIETLENEKQRFEKNEINLIKNLSDQQKLTKEALNKLYHYQEEGLKEKDRFKDYYEMQLKEKLEKMEDKYRRKIKALKKNNHDLLLMNKNQENKEEGLIKSYGVEINNLKNQLNLQINENENMRKENFALKNEIKERREKVEMDLNQLKTKMLSDNEVLIRENEEKVFLKQKIQTLNKELEIKEKKTKENEEFYKHEMDKLEEKIALFQEKFYQSHENKAKIEELHDLLRKKESECNLYKNLSQEKPLQKAPIQTNQKQQWSKIYNELLDEIKGLKVEIDQLGSENKKLLSSVSNNRFASESQKNLSTNRVQF